MNSISTVLKQTPAVQVIGRSTTKPFLVYDDIPIMSLGLGFRRPKSALSLDGFVNTIHRPYRLPLDITPEFLKMDDYLNEGCYPKPSNGILLWLRYPHVPQLKGLPECHSSSTHTSVSNQWNLKKKMR